MVYNPSFAGDKDVTEIFALNRNQFSDFQGAPVLNVLTADGKLQNNKAYFGFLVANQRKGISSNTNAMASYAYRVNFSDEMYLKFGLSLGVFDQSINYSKILVANYSDPYLFTNQQRKTSMDGNAGLSFYLKGLAVGFSVPQLMAGKLNYQDNTNVRAYYMMARHFASSVKYEIPINKEKEIYVTPNAIVRMVANAPLQYDAGVTFDWKDKFWIGGLYRSDYAIGINTGVTLNRRFSVGYSYDYMIGNITKYAGISQEIFISVKLGKLKYKMGDDTLTPQDKKIMELQKEVENLKKNGVKTASNGNNTEKDAASDAFLKANPTQFGGKNAVKENGVYILTNKAADFIYTTGTMVPKGIYIVVESCFYKDYADNEAKRYASFGFPDADVMIDKTSKFHYVFIDKAANKDEALQKVKDAKESGVPDVWIQILIE
jgi:type IX secretion system PorP/SprF family membrane protein